MSAEMTVMRNIKGCTRLVRIKNEYFREKLNIFAED